MTSSRIRIGAPAKLNLFLHVTGKRPDGYHLLESLVVFTGFGDLLECAPADGITVTVTGPFAGALSGDGDANLVTRAARLLQEKTGVRAGAHITLHKHIPVGAGLGGGSADAAATLLALKALWKLDVSAAELQAMARTLGSDVPVCLLRRPAWMRGAGEQVAPADIYDRLWVVLANPGATLLTADVFRRFVQAFSPPLAASVPASPDGLVAFLKQQHNALEAPAVALIPAIADVVAAIKNTDGCLLARMSGSGATCFGLYADALHARQAMRALQQRHPAWWCAASELHDERRAAA